MSSGSIEPLFVSSRQNRAFAVGTLHEPGDLGAPFSCGPTTCPTGLCSGRMSGIREDGVDSDHPTAIVAGPTQVVVMGYGQNRAENGLSVLVRAYDPETGDVLWENREHRDGFDLVAFTIAANRNRVFIAGRTAPAGALSTHDLFLRAYDADTGALVWETSRPLVTTQKLTLTSGRLVVAGGTSSSSYLAAFSAKSGRLLWEDAAPITGMFTDVAVKGSLLVGAVQSGSGYAVRVHDVATGQLQWQDRPTVAPGFRQQILAVGLNNDAVYAAGTAGQDFGNSEFLVRAYDATRRDPALGRSLSSVQSDRGCRSSAGKVPTVRRRLHLRQRDELGLSHTRLRHPVRCDGCELTALSPSDTTKNLMLIAPRLLRRHRRPRTASRSTCADRQ